MKRIKRIADGEIFSWNEVLAARDGFETIIVDDPIEMLSLEDLDKMPRPQLISRASALKIEGIFKKDNPTLIMEIHKTLLDLKEK